MIEANLVACFVDENIYLQKDKNCNEEEFPRLEFPGLMCLTAPSRTEIVIILSQLILFINCF